MAAKKRSFALLVAAIAFLAAPAVFASIPRNEILAPAIEHFAFENAPPARPQSTAVLPLDRQLRSAAVAAWPLDRLPETRVGDFDFAKPLLPQAEPQLSRALRQGYERLERRRASGDEYVDSSNLYAAFAMDPVNNSDPTGEAASVSRSGVIIGIRPDGSRYRIEPGTDPVVALRILESDADLGFDEQEDLLTRARMTIPYSSAPRPGEYLLSSGKPNYRAFTHEAKGDNWPMNALIATSGLPPQNRQQQIVQGGLQIASSVSLIGATKAQAGTVRAEVMMNYQGAGPITVSHAEAEGMMLPHRNRLDATGPHDVYAIVDRATGQVYHFGETGRGWKTRGREWVKTLRDEYGLDTQVVELRSGLPGKAAAKELETRYITTYEKAFGRRPFHINEKGEVITIQKTRH